MATATLGAGCFWCTEAVFQRLNGVSQVLPGYAGGKISTPTYREVCSGLTGHAEVIQVTFDAEAISFKEILEVFFKTHDPTTPNRQGADRGTQYRSVIFYHSEQQRQDALEVKKALDDAAIFDNPIVTEISEAPVFYKAEKDHIDFYNQNQEQPYCQIIINPKLNKLNTTFQHLLTNNNHV